MSWIKKTKDLVIIVSLIPVIAIGQLIDPGVRFESGLSWKAIQAKAQAENKYIFVDFYATWCGPCKWMSKNIFVQKEVGDFINAHFISVAVQADRTEKDLKNIRNWYSDARMLADSFSVNEYPTYLFFFSDGQLVHKFIGTTPNGATFIKKTLDVLDPNRQFYNLLKSWKDHKEDSIYLFAALTAAKNMGSGESSEMSDAYIKLLKNPLTRENIQILGALMNSIQDKAFQLYYQNLSTIHDLMGSDYAEAILCPIIFKDETAIYFDKSNEPVYWNQIAGSLRKYPKLEQFGDQLPKFEKLFKKKIYEEIFEHIKNGNSLVPDWNKIYSFFTDRYSGYDIKLIYLYAKLAYCQKMSLTEEHAKTALTIVDQFGNIEGDWQMNNFIWDHIFNITADKEILNGALQWMKMSVSRRLGDLEAYDTYANLLYKTGNLQEAIVWETKCIELSNDDEDCQEFKITLEKIKNGQPTWKDSLTSRTLHNN